MDKLSALAPRPHSTRCSHSCWFFAQLQNLLLIQCVVCVERPSSCRGAIERAGNKHGLHPAMHLRTVSRMQSAEAGTPASDVASSGVAQPASSHAPVTAEAAPAMRTKDVAACGSKRTMR